MSKKEKNLSTPQNPNNHDINLHNDNNKPSIQIDGHISIGSDLFLPPARELKQYNEIDPTFAKRIMDRADRVMDSVEKEGERRHFLNIFGQITAFIVVIFALVCITYLGLNGQQWLAGGALIIVFGSIVGSYMATIRYMKEKNKHNKTDKDLK